LRVAVVHLVVCACGVRAAVPRCLALIAALAFCLSVFCCSLTRAAACFFAASSCLFLSCPINRRCWFPDSTEAAVLASATAAIAAVAAI
jgi:hypothetical protein